MYAKDEIKLVKKNLKNENPKHLQCDLLLAPVLVRKLSTSNE